MLPPFIIIFTLVHIIVDPFFQLLRVARNRYDQGFTLGVELVRQRVPLRRRGSAYQGEVPEVHAAGGRRRRLGGYRRAMFVFFIRRFRSTLVVLGRRRRGDARGRRRRRRGH